MCEKPRLIAIVGPTASGKTAMAVRLAGYVSGEIVSCDSMQIYRGLDIGTAKPTEEEKQGVPHHLIDIAGINEPFSCADYVLAANKVISEIYGRKKLPILCGGTGLYAESVLNGSAYSTPGRDDGFREEAEKLTNDEIYDRLSELDPVSAAASHKNNRKRNIRALEIYRLTGIPKSVSDAYGRACDPPYDALVIGLCCSDRSYLYSRIDARVDDMISRGLVDEVSSLDFSKSPTASQAIGYKEILSYLRGEATLDEAVDRLKRASRNYAKRQITWFSATPGIISVDIYGKDPTMIFEEICGIVDGRWQDIRS